MKTTTKLWWVSLAIAAAAVTGWQSFHSELLPEKPQKTASASMQAVTPSEVGSAFGIAARQTADEAETVINAAAPTVAQAEAASRALMRRANTLAKPALGALGISTGESSVDLFMVNQAEPGRKARREEQEWKDFRALVAEASATKRASEINLEKRTWMGSLLGLVTGKHAASWASISSSRQMLALHLEHSIVSVSESSASVSSKHEIEKAVRLLKLIETDLKPLAEKAHAENAAPTQTLSF